jgi:4-amino-4-deoxy-L-arabinose transferase-like glycosyltransferase
MVGAAGHPPGRVRRPGSRLSRGSQLPQWLVAASSLWAAWLRIPQLASLPPQAYVDEAWYNLTARNLLQTHAFQIFYPTFWGGMRPLLVDLSALIQALGFHSLVASRAITAIAGVLCVPLTYVCLAELLRREPWSPDRRRLTAAVAAVVAPNLLVQLIASRVGYAPILIPLLTLFAVWHMRRAERTGRWLGWVLAGVGIGLSQYVNINGAFVLGTLGLLALLDLARAAPGQRGRWLAGMVLMCMVAVLSAMPILLFFARQPQWLFARAQAVSPQTNRWAFYLDNAWQIALSFSVRGDQGLRQNVPGRPMLDLVQSIGFWVGALWCGWRLRRSSTARDLPVWLVAASLPSLLTVDAPQFERMVGVAAPVAMLVAIGGSVIWVRLAGWLRQRARAQPGSRAPGWLTVLACGLGLASTAATAYAFFGVYPLLPGLAAAFTATPATVAQQMITLAHTQPVFVERTPEVDDAFAFDYLFPGTPVQRLDFRQCLPRPDGRATPTTFVVLTDHDPQTAALLQQLYPGATVTRIEPEDAALVGELAVVDVPAGARLAGPEPEHAVSAELQGGLQLLGYDWSGPEVMAGQPLYLTLYWKALVDQKSQDTAFVHLGQGTAGSPLVAAHDGQPCQGLYPTTQWRAGDVVPDSFAIAVPASAAAGTYPLLAGWYDSQTQQRLVLTAADQALNDNRIIIGSVNITAP